MKIDQHALSIITDIVYLWNQVIKKTYKYINYMFSNKKAKKKDLLLFKTPQMCLFHVTIINR